MNDGTLDYKNYHSVDSLAFGHCDYSYRNLGRPSKLRIKQETGNFEITIDDKVCFKSDKVGLMILSTPVQVLTRIERYECLPATISVSQLPPQKPPTPSKPINSSCLPPNPSLVRSLENHNLHPASSQTKTQRRLQIPQLLPSWIIPLNSKTSTIAYKSWLTNLTTSSERSKDLQTDRKADTKRRLGMPCQ